MRVLDFDIENRPLSYKGMDLTTAEVTAISWAWTDQPKDVEVHLLGKSKLIDILPRFVDAFNMADLVTGHYILGHDLPMINGALVEHGLPVLQDKLVSDTKVHFVKVKGLSLSQESLAAMMRLDRAKVHMNQAMWREANRLTPEGLEYVHKRVTWDVRQHIAMAKELNAKGYLGPARIWRSGATASALPAYAP